MKPRNAPQKPGRRRLTNRPPAASPVPLRAGPVEPPFPIVGLGASAGGLEALEQFFQAVPAASGMAFVVVQHLDPTHEDLLPELLQRATPMPVVHARDRLPVQPDCVYVIPPNHDLAIRNGVLHLLAPGAPRGLWLPIDAFFRSLAADQQSRSVGVILSGMGTDGTLGLRAIKEQAGLVLVQEPGSARCDGMPRSAIDTGLADGVAPAAALPGKLLELLRPRPRPPRPGLGVGEGKSRSALDQVASLLRAHTGHDFSQYKKSTIQRRIERRMGLHQITRLGHYVRYLQEHRPELELLFKELLIGVTSFFRDPAVWDQLKAQGLPALLARPGCGRALRAWVPGCSSGEEAYSLAMVFREVLEQVRPERPCALQVFATDLDADAIARARRGLYPAAIAADVSPERLARFFVREDGGYRVGKQIREMVIFATQNVIMDPPFTKLDLLTCRNLLIYLEPALQRTLIPFFHYSLGPDGLLLLGSAESIGSHTNLFTPVDVKSKLFRRLPTSRPAEVIELPSVRLPAATRADGTPRTPVPPGDLQALTEQVLLQQHAPPAVLANDQGDILYISGRTGRYLEPAAGKANWNVFAMAREGLRYELAGAFQKVAREGGEVRLHRLRVATEGPLQTVDVRVGRLETPEALHGLILIVFTEVLTAVESPAPTRGRRRPAGTPVAAPDPEFEQARLELQATREQMQTGQEELRSMNEELQSTNEELQSTNEELTTSKEEMQSLNEELQTVNAELRAKVDELSRANNDMKNLLNSTEIATVFLDNELNVRRFTTAAARIIKLIPGDVGRPVTDLASALLYPDLVADATSVLQTLAFTEKQITTRGGDWFAVRIMPYRTVENVIDGVVITFLNITGHRQRVPAESRPSGTTELRP